MRKNLRAAAGVAAATLVAAAAAALPAAPAHAADVYTWVQGYDGDGDAIPTADHVSWSNPANWSPQGVPAEGDSVVLTNAPHQSATTLTTPSGLRLKSFSMSQPGAGNVYLVGSPLMVTDGFDWTGGSIAVPLTVAGQGRVGAGALKSLTGIGSGLGRLEVTGTLTLDGIGDGDSRVLVTPSSDGAPDGIHVAAGATLRASGTNVVAGAGCCVAPARIVVDGTVAVTSGRTTLTALELDLRGTAAVSPGAVLGSTIGPARLGAGARYTGGGTVELTETASIRAYPDKEPFPGGALMEGTGRFEGGTTLHLGVGAKLTGTGGFTGPGTVDVSAPANPAQNSATVYGELTIGAGTLLRLGGAVPSRLSAWNPDLPGYRGALHLLGTASLAAGSTFVAQGGTQTTIAKGGTLQLTAGSTWGTGDCCTRPASLTNLGTLRVAGGTGGAAQVVRVDLRTQGTLALAAGKRLATSGYPVHLGGTLAVADRTRPGKQRTAVTAQQLTGTFACVSPHGQVATYTATQARVTGVVGSTKRCLTPGKGKRIAKKSLAPRKTLRAKAAKGVAKKTKKVLLAVTVAKVRKPAPIKVSGAPAFKAQRGTKTTRYVVAKRSAAKNVTVKNKGRKAVKITVRLLGKA